MFLAEIGQREGGIRQDTRVVSGHFQGPPGKLGSLAAVRLGVRARASDAERSDNLPLARMRDSLSGMSVRS
jgi:hypothetical protein